MIEEGGRRVARLQRFVGRGLPRLQPPGAGGGGERGREQHGRGQPRLVRGRECGRAGGGICWHACPTIATGGSGSAMPARTPTTRWCACLRRRHRAAASSPSSAPITAAAPPRCRCRATAHRVHAPARAGLTRLVYPDPYRPQFTPDLVQGALDDLDRRFESELRPDEIAAVFIEPIQSDGGLIVPPAGFPQGAGGTLPRPRHSDRGGRGQGGGWGAPACSMPSRPRA